MGHKEARSNGGCGYSPRTPGRIQHVNLITRIRDCDPPKTMPPSRCIRSISACPRRHLSYVLCSLQRICSDVYVLPGLTESNFKPERTICTSRQDVSLGTDSTIEPLVRCTYCGGDFRNFLGKRRSTLCDSGGTDGEFPRLTSFIPFPLRNVGLCCKIERASLHIARAVELRYGHKTCSLLVWIWLNSSMPPARHPHTLTQPHHKLAPWVKMNLMSFASVIPTSLLFRVALAFRLIRH